MSEPDRIWICHETRNIWVSEEQDDTTEYVRADLATQSAEITKLKADLTRERDEASNHVAELELERQRLSEDLKAAEAEQDGLAKVIEEAKFALFSSDLTIKDRADQSMRLALASYRKGASQ